MASKSDYLDLQHFQKRINLDLAGQGINILFQFKEDAGNGNHSVSLTMILMKIYVNQMLLSSYIHYLQIYRLPGLNHRTKQRIKCLAQGHNAVPPVRFEPANSLISSQALNQ